MEDSLNELRILNLTALKIKVARITACRGQCVSVCMYSVDDINYIVIIINHS